MRVVVHEARQRADEFLSRLRAYPCCAATTASDDFEEALDSQAQVMVILRANGLELRPFIDQVHAHGKLAVVHIDLVSASLVGRHGTEAPDVLVSGQEHDLNRQLVAGLPYLEAEVAWAVRNELALSLDDILARRLRLAPVLSDRGASIAPRVAAIAGRTLGWDDARQAVEVSAYLDGARCEYAVPGPEPGRISADAA